MSNKAKTVCFHLMICCLLFSIVSCNEDDPLSTGTTITVSGNQNGTYIADADFMYSVLSEDTLGQTKGTYFSLNIQGHKASAPQVSIEIYDYTNTEGYEVRKKYAYPEMPSASRFFIRVRSDASYSGPIYRYYINTEDPGINWIQFSYIGSKIVRGKFEFNLESNFGEKIKAEGVFFASGEAHFF